MRGWQWFFNGNNVKFNGRFVSVEYLHKQVEMLLESHKWDTFDEKRKRNLLSKREWRSRKELELDLPVFYNLCIFAIKGCSKNFLAKLGTSVRAACKYLNGDGVDVESFVLKWVMAYVVEKLKEKAEKQK